MFVEYWFYENRNIWVGNMEFVCCGVCDSGLWEIFEIDESVGVIYISMCVFDFVSFNLLLYKMIE